MRLEAGMLSLVTGQGYEVQIGCLSKRPSQACLDGLGRAAGGCRLEPGDDERTVDWKLCKALLEADTDAMPAIGASIRAPWVRRPCGGVLGSPNQSPRSAEGVLECLEEGVCLFTLPGKLGVAAVADPDILKRVLRGVDFEGAGLLKAREAILTGLERMGIETAILVADGCGPENTGGVSVLDKGRIIHGRFKEGL